ncbi:MAG: histidine phosphatase family protein [Acidimicrobiales bacterium]
MPAFLVRHAHAGSKSQWKGDDAARPVSARGAAQAEAIADVLEGEGVRRIVSSPTARCTGTVAPLAERLGLKVRTRKVLAPDAVPDEAIAYLLDHADENPVLSTHGEVIPKVIALLVDRGMRIKDPIVSEKASIWVLDIADGTVVRGRYLPPPRTGS